MRPWLALGLSIFGCALLAACHSGPAEVDLTIAFDESFSDTDLALVKSLHLRASGILNGEDMPTLTGGRRTYGIVIHPKLAVGTPLSALKLSAEALDGTAQTIGQNLPSAELMLDGKKSIPKTLTIAKIATASFTFTPAAVTGSMCNGSASVTVALKDQYDGVSDAGQTISATGTASVFVSKASVVTACHPNGRRTNLSGDCTGVTTCTFTPTATAMVTAQFDPDAGYAFVTTAKYSRADLAAGGNVLATAKTLCETEAHAAGLAGSFVPWLSLASANVRDAITSKTTGWVRTDGMPFTPRFIDLTTSDVVLFPLTLDAAAHVVPTGDPVWTGTTRTGVSSGSNCSDYTAEVGGDGKALGSEFGSVGAGAGAWTSQLLHPVTPNSMASGNPSGEVLHDCKSTAHLYCFERYAGPDVPTVPAVVGDTRRAFLSRTGFSQNDGKADGIVYLDKLCECNAKSGGITPRHAFVAFVANLTPTAASANTRLGLGDSSIADTLTYVRLDGVPFTTVGQLRAGMPPLNSLTVGPPATSASPITYRNTWVFTAARDPVTQVYHSVVTPHTVNWDCEALGVQSWAARSTNNEVGSVYGSAAVIADWFSLPASGASELGLTTCDAPTNAIYCLESSTLPATDPTGCP